MLKSVIVAAVAKLPRLMVGMVLHRKAGGEVKKTGCWGEETTVRKKIKEIITLSEMAFDNFSVSKKFDFYIYYHMKRIK